MAVVVLLHGLLLAASWFERVDPPSPTAPVLTVALLSAPRSIQEEKPPTLPAVQLTVPMPAILVDAPSIQIPVINEIQTQRAISRPVSPALAQVATENLDTELVVQCPERTPPRYPPLAKRLREQGEVRLRVELDENGHIGRVTVVSSSGYPRLDAAARTAIKSWHCRPPEHEGHPVRAVAMQSLAFVLDRQ